MKYISILIVLAFALCATASAQRSDYMTSAEQDVVRNNQEVDSRIAVLTYMIDRRIIAMGIQTKANKPPLGPEDDWGPEPKGTKPELLSDIRYLLEKAIDDIDNLAARMPGRGKEERNGANLFNKAVKALEASAKRWMPILKKEFESASDEQAYSATATSVGFCEQIIEAAARLK